MNILEARRRVLGGEVYKKTAEGNPISVRSLARMRPGLSVMGKSTQKTTTGAQLINIPDDYSGESNGVTWSAKDGVVHLSGTSTADVFTTNVDITDLIEPEQDYYISNNAASESIYAYLEVHYTDETPNDYIQNNIYTAKPNIEKVIFHINVPSGATVDVDVCPMLNKGSTALPWEPYTGGKPSPSPDYPQEIASEGDNGSIEVDVTGANMFDISKAIPSTSRPYMLDISKDDEYIYVTGNPNSVNTILAFRILGYPTLIYGNSFSANFAESQGINAAVSYVYQNNYDMSIALTIRLLEAGNPINLKFKIMVNEGNEKLPYEPYKQPQSLTVQTPNGLPGIPVTSGGNYTDENGQQWICDEIDFKRGKYVQRVAWVTFDGSEDELWLFDSNDDPVSLSARGRVLMYGMCSQKKRNHVLCNRRIYSKNTYYDTENACFSDRANIYIYGEKATVETESEWRQDLSEKPVTVLYEMETPIETDLSEEQLSAYSNLHTNRPTTVVSATDDVGIKLTYKTKKSLEVT